MARLRQLLARLAALGDRHDADVELTEELETHLALLEDELRARGFGAAEARRAARQRLGGITQTSHAVRDARLPMLLDQLRQEVIWAVRSLRQTPAFTVATVMTLALAIGGMVAVFTIVNAVLFRPLPYPDSERVVALTGADPVSVSGEIVHALREQYGPDVPLAAIGGTSSVNLRSGAGARRVEAGRVSRETFDVLQVPPQIGRRFTELEDTPGGPAVAVISDAFWRTHFSASADVLGQTLHLGGVPHDVVGVMPAGFRSFPPADLWRPLQLSAHDQGLNYGVLMRLPDGTSIDAARARLETVRLALRDRLGWAGSFTTPVTWVSYRHLLGHDRRADLLVLQAAVLCALLLACVNVAGLQLVRAATKRAELATRAALGGSPARLMRQTAVEALLLGGAGVLLGLLCTWWGLPRLVEALPATLTSGIDIVPDVRVVAMTVASLLLVVISIGLLPACAVRRLDLRDALAATSRQTASRSTQRWRRAFVVSQLVLALMLVVGAALLARTLANYHRVDLGFEPAGLVTAAMSLQGATDQTQQAPARFIEQTLERLRGVPGVTAATVASNLPVDRALNLALEPPADSRITQPRAVDWQYVASGFRDTLGVVLRTGRDFAPTDTADAPPVALVNEAFVSTYFGDGPVIGRTIRLAIGDLDVSRTIVGVLRDVRASSGTGWTRGRNALETPAAPGIYVPLSQVSPALLTLVHGFARVHWLVRGHGDPAALARRASATVLDAEPHLPSSTFVPVTSVVAEQIEMERALLWLMAALGGGALLLASLGTYGLMASSVHLRTREIGIRLALGASRTRVVAEMVRDGARLVAIGVTAGIPVALAGARTIRAYLWGVEPFDPTALAIAVAVLLVVSMVAILVPAARAARIAPARVLRA